MQAIGQVTTLQRVAIPSTTASAVGSRASESAPGTPQDQVTFSPQAQGMLVAMRVMSNGNPVEQQRTDALTDRLYRLDAAAQASEASGWSAQVSVHVRSADGSGYDASGPDASASVTTGNADAQVSVSLQTTGISPNGDAGRVFVYTGAGDDKIDVDTNTGATIEAKDGNNTINARFTAESFPQSNSLDRISSITTGNGRDLVSVSGTGTAVVSTGAGDDVIRATGPNDVFVNGGDGNDLIEGVETACGGDGNDTIRGATLAIGGKGDDRIEQGSVARMYVAFGSGDGHDTVVLTPPSEAITPHAIFDLRATKASDIDATLDGTTLTMTLRSSGDSITVQNYKAGSATFLTAGANPLTPDSSDVPPGFPSIDRSA